PNHELVIPICQQFQIVLWLWLGDGFIGPEFSLSAAWLGKWQEHQCQKQTRRASPDECVPPAPVSCNFSSENVTQSRTDRDGDIKDRESIVAPGRDESIGDQAGTNRRVAGFA